MLAGKAQKSTVAPPATGKREGSSLVPEAVKRAKTSDNETVRIWWPPTESKKKGGFSGMYWPATVLRIMADTCEVVYDNGDKEIVEAENVFPVPPVGFGEESSQFMVRPCRQSSDRRDQLVAPARQRVSKLPFVKQNSRPAALSFVP